MTKITIQTPVEIEVHACDYLPAARNDELMQEIKRRLCDYVQMHKTQFLDLVDAIVEMRFSDAFALMEAVDPALINASGAQDRQLDHILAKGKEQAQ